MTAKPRKRCYCRTCGAEFESKAGKLPCPKPSPGRPFVDCGRGGHMFSLDRKPGSKPRKHRITTRITAAQRVEMYEVYTLGPDGPARFDQDLHRYLIRAFQAHALASLARERRRNRAAR